MTKSSFDQVKYSKGGIDFMFNKSDYNLNKTDPEAIVCYNMLDPKSSMLKNVLFSGSYQSYNERVIGLSKHCLS